MRIKGRVKFFDTAKGFGFITRDDGKGDVFVHANELKRSNVDGIEKGEELTFEPEIVQKGTRAKNIERV